jgi:hypothetical protein
MDQINKFSTNSKVSSPSFTPRELIYRKINNPQERITDEIIDNLVLDIYNYAEKEDVSNKYALEVNE